MVRVLSVFVACVMGGVLAFGPPARGQDSDLVGDDGDRVADAVAGHGDAAPQPPAGLESGDWASIHDAYEASQRALAAVDGGHRARNPGQRWTTLFDGRGFTVQPDDRSWEWGLELVAFGPAGDETPIDGSAASHPDGDRLTYERSPVLDEWFVNDARGLEHGFLVRDRPARGSLAGAGQLRFTLAVRGGLRAEVASDGRGVRFCDVEGSCVLRYSGLTVCDATGSTVPARIVADASDVVLVVDDRGAVYPITIDPVAQQAYLKSSNPGASDEFGWTVAASGDTIVVGAPYEDSGASGVGGDAADNSLLDAGAAYVFVRNGATWTQQAYLKASNPGYRDEFGWSVAISGDTIIVGAHYEDSAATGVDGDQANDNAVKSGAAYVFVRNNGDWIQQAYLKASNAGASDFFGSSVALSGDTAVIGALGDPVVLWV